MFFGRDRWMIGFVVAGALIVPLLAFVVVVVLPTITALQFSSSAMTSISYTYIDITAPNGAPVLTISGHWIWPTLSLIGGIAGAILGVLTAFIRNLVRQGRR